MDTENISIQFIKSKLNKYGISFENFQLQTGNLVGKVIVPSTLRAFNRNLTAEQAFYFVANKVFESANLLAFGIPAKLEDCYDRVVSHEDFKDFQKAIYEEINQRFISNTFPEFANAGNVSLSNVSIQNGYMGGQYIQDWVNPVSRQIISNIDWRQYDEAADVERDKVYMYRNMYNAWLPLSESKRFILALEDGSVGYTDINEFATQANLELAGEAIKQNYDQQVQNKTDINILKEETKKLASLDYVNNIALAFPKTEEWNPDKIYNRPQFVVYNGCIYWNLVDNNINKVPGGITGNGYWIKVRDLFVANNVSSIIYAPGTDIKYSISNPNNLYYVSIEDILKIPELSLNTLFTYLDNNYPHLNLTIDNVQDFFNNLCNSDVTNLIYTFGKKLKFSRDEIILFDDEMSMNDFIQKNNLSNTGDYSLINYGDYLRFSKSGSTNLKRGGNNKIARNQLPNLNWNSISNFQERGDETWKTGNGNVALWGYNTSIQLNGNVTQQEHEPKYYTIFAIKINKDIYYENSIKSWTNIVKMSLEGKLIKSEDGNEEIDNSGLNKVYYKNKKETTDGVVHELYDQDKNIFAVPDVSYNINLKNWILSKINESAKLNDPNQDINLNDLFATMIYSYSLAFRTNKTDDNPLGIANVGITTDDNGNQLILATQNGTPYQPQDDNSLITKAYVDNIINNVDLSNVLLKNETNIIAIDKLLTTTNQNNTIFESINNSEKKMYFDFIQQKGGYRNWNHLIFRSKLGSNDYENILDVYSKDVGGGLWLNVGNNKINFDSETLIGGVATPVGNNDVANKQYVDSKVSQIAQVDLNNVPKLNERNEFTGYNMFQQLSIIGNQNDLGKLIFTPPIPYYEAYIEYNSPNTRNNDVCLDLYIGNKQYGDNYNYQQSEYAIMRHKDVVDYVANNIPQRPEINLFENIEVPIPGYSINGKQVYQMYITTDDQFKQLISKSDYLEAKGLVRKGNYYKSYPWFWGTGEVYSLDAQSSGGLCNKGFSVDGHKLTVIFTKK